MKKRMTYARLRALSNCLQALAGRDKPLKDKDGIALKDKDGGVAVEYVPYKFLDATVRPAIAINQASLSVHVQALQTGMEGVDKLLKGFKTGDPVPLDVQIEMNEARAALLKKVVEVDGLRRIDYAKLDPDGNDIPASVVAGLVPVLTNFPAESSAADSEWQESEEPAAVIPSVNGQEREKVEA